MLQLRYDVSINMTLFNFDIKLVEFLMLLRSINTEATPNPSVLYIPLVASSLSESKSFQTIRTMTTSLIIGKI